MGSCRGSASSSSSMQTTLDVVMELAPDGTAPEGPTASEFGDVLFPGGFANDLFAFAFFRVAAPIRLCIHSSTSRMNFGWSATSLACVQPHAFVPMAPRAGIHHSAPARGTHDGGNKRKPHRSGWRCVRPACQSFPKCARNMTLCTWPCRTWKCSSS